MADRRTVLISVLGIGLVVLTHAEAALRRFDNWMAVKLGEKAPRGSCPLCRAPMVATDGGQRLMWYRCGSSTCGKAQVGLGPGQGLA